MVHVRTAPVWPALVLVLLLAPAAAADPWGADNNPGDGPRLIEAAAPELARIVAAPEAERGALIAAYVAGKAGEQIEAVKRFRNPELIPLFRALAAHKDWKVRHRAFYALEYYADPGALPLAFEAMKDPEPRLREKAALTAIRVWSPAAAKGLPGDAAAAVADLLDRETNPHVATCLAALRQRITGKLHMRQVYEEHLEKRPDGLLFTPFLSGMNTAPTVAPNWVKKGISEGGGGAAAKLPAGPWTSPIILYGEEARQGMSLQPFANLRGEGGTTYHTGVDVGACLDGAGYYAIAPGFVRFVYTGSDMGTEIVVQHHLGDKRTVNAVYMHGGDTVFVKGGDEVVSGQLLGTMGMSFSIENGGHFAHLHFGLYPGEFATTHNYGYRGVKAGLVDWYDPNHYIPLWMELSRPLVPPLRSRKDLGKAADLVAEGDLAGAYAAAEGQGEPGAKLRAEIEKAVASAPERAAKIRDLGYPSRALAFLEETAKAVKGIPGDDAVADALKDWKADKALKEAIKAEKRIPATEERALAGAADPAEAKALWEALLEASEGTCLVPRLKKMIEGVGLR